jgi:hypothetical protein
MVLAEKMQEYLFSPEVPCSNDTVITIDSLTQNTIRIGKVSIPLEYCAAAIGIFQGYHRDKEEQLLIVGTEGKDTEFFAIYDSSPVPASMEIYSAGRCTELPYQDFIEGIVEMVRVTRTLKEILTVAEHTGEDPLSLSKFWRTCEPNLPKYLIKLLPDENK